MKARAFFLGVILGGAQIAQCNAVYEVNLGTSDLVGHPAGPFALELQFNDGSGTGDANNTATLSDFTFGGGSAGGLPSSSGGVTGDLTSSVVMTDSSFFNQFIQEINPGESLAFQLNLTTNLDSGAVPDEFSLSILDSSGVEIPTFGPANALLVIDIDAEVPSISAYASDTSIPPNAGGAPIDIDAPNISAAGSSTPEPATFLLMGVALVAVLTSLLLRRANRRVERIDSSLPLF